MKKKRLREFIVLFQFLPVAEMILSGNRERLENDLPEKETEICSLRDKIWNLNDPKDPFMTALFDEIDDNLYKHPLNQQEYIEDILISFKELAPFLDEEEFHKNEEETWFLKLYEDYGATRNLIARFCEDAEKYSIDHYSDTEQYVINCYCLMYNFFYFLDGRCIHFKLDLMKIQEEMNIFIGRNRIIDHLIDSGYGSKIKLLGIRDQCSPRPKNGSPMKALPPATAVEQQNNDFTGWLQHEHPGRLATLCGELFNRRKSPKIFAIMVSLLCLKKFIVLHERRRREFYESWYIFIDRPLPANNNYDAINKHLDLSNGIVFVNDQDPDYINLKRKFEKELPLLKDKA